MSRHMCHCQLRHLCILVSGPASGQWQPGHVSGQQPDANMMMQQIQQLQQTVRELQSGGGGGGGYPGGAGGQGAPGGYSSGAMPGTQGMSNYRTGGTWSSGANGEKGGMNTKTEINEEEQTVLLVSNIPPTLANPDSLFYVFEKFGTVVKVKVLHNKRNTALIQMSQPSEAQLAIQQQEQLNRNGGDIYVNFSSKFADIRMPEPGSIHDDGLSKDFTGKFVSLHVGNPRDRPQQFGMDMGGGFNGGFGGGMDMMRGGGMGGFGGGRGGGGFHGDMGGDNFDNYGGRGQGGGGVVLLISNIPDEIANVDNIFNMIGMYGDVMFVKILRNKRDCAMVQMAKPHHAQQVKQCLDHAKIGGNKLCVSYSRVDNLLNKRMEEGDELQRNFVNSRNHRYRNHNTAAKLQKNLGPPTSTLHVANLPEGFTSGDIRVSGQHDYQRAGVKSSYCRICSLRRVSLSKRLLSVEIMATWHSCQCRG